MSAWKATRVRARQPLSPWRTIRVSRSPTSVPRAKAAPSCTAAIGANWWRTSPTPSEYYWMAGNFIKYAGPLNWNDLPVDSHELIALCAPRPVFSGAGADRAETDGRTRKGMFLAAAGAGPVYKLLGGKDLGTTEFPPVGTALIDGDVAFRQHPGGHTDLPNWPTFLTFADRYMKAPRDLSARR